MRFDSLGTSELETLMDQCLELGLTDYDHADIYGHYTVEEHFGQVLKRRPDLRQKLEITTKCGIKLTSSNRPNHLIKSYDTTVKHIQWSVENSLRELGIERIKLLLIHRPDHLIDPHEIAAVVEVLKQEGKIEHFGVSNFTTSQFALLHGFTPLVTNQIEHSLISLDALDNGTLDQCLHLGVQPMAWSPLGRGEILGEGGAPRIDRIKRVAQEIADSNSTSLDQILLAWVMKHPSGIVPIVGSTKFGRIKSAYDAVKVKMTHEEWYMLLEASRGHQVA